MRLYKIFISISLFWATNILSLEKTTKPLLDYAIAYHNIKNLEKNKDIHRSQLITSYEDKRKECIEQLLKQRTTINKHIEKLIEEKRISQQEYAKLMEMSFASLANLYVEFPSLKNIKIDALNEDKQ